MKSVVFLLLSLLLIAACGTTDTGNGEVTGVQKPIVESTGTISIDMPTALESYTLADVASHASAESCWTTINGKIYNLTGWIDQHPGGDRNILKLCGIDGTAAFERQHGGQSKPENTLDGFKIGTLA